MNILNRIKLLYNNIVNYREISDKCRQCWLDKLQYTIPGRYRNSHDRDNAAIKIYARRGSNDSDHLIVFKFSRREFEFAIWRSAFANFACTSLTGDITYFNEIKLHRKSRDRLRIFYDLQADYTAYVDVLYTDFRQAVDSITSTSYQQFLQQFNGDVYSAYKHVNSD